MPVVATVRSIMRYPVKSMGGESLPSAMLTFQGIPFDRQFAFVQSESRRAFPWLTARELPTLLGHHACVSADAPPRVTVASPTGETWDAASDDGLATIQRAANQPLFRLRDYRGSFDVAPLSLITHGTVDQIAAESDTEPEPLRFRANLYLDGAEADGFGEERWIGRVLRIGASARIAVQQADERCVMITLDPAGGPARPEVLRVVAQGHANRAGVYAVVLAEGEIRVGDQLHLDP